MPSGGVQLILMAQMSSFSDQNGEKNNNNTTLMEQFVVKKDMDVNEHEIVSNITLSNK
jgi:hypothetical protein